MLDVLVGLNSLPSKLTQKQILSLERPARTKHLESFIKRVIFTSRNKPKAGLIPSELNVSRHNKFPHRIRIGHSWESGFIRNEARHPDPAQETRRRNSTFHSRTAHSEKTCLVTNIAHIPPYVLLMAKLHQVMDLSVNDRVLRNSAGNSEHANR